MIIRTEKIKNYTKIDNNYLEDKNISLKAKGLLTLMLSLPDSWKYNIKGLCLLCKESRYSITYALKELKQNNYLEVKKSYDYDGKFIYEYIIYENPYNPKVVTDLLDMDN